MKLATTTPFKLALAAASIATVGVIGLGMIESDPPVIDRDAMGRAICIQPRERVEPPAIVVKPRAPEPMPPASF